MTKYLYKYEQCCYSISALCSFPKYAKRYHNRNTKSIITISNEGKTLVSANHGIKFQEMEPNFGLGEQEDHGFDFRVYEGVSKDSAGEERTDFVVNEKVTE